LSGLSRQQRHAAQEASRAQKRKAKAAAAEAEREARIAEENAAAGDSARVVEEAALRDVLRPLGLAVRDIPVRAEQRQLCGVLGFRVQRGGTQRGALLRSEGQLAPVESELESSQPPLQLLSLSCPECVPRPSWCQLSGCCPRQLHSFRGAACNVATTEV